MRRSLNSQALNSATSIASTSQVSDRVNRANPVDLYRFDLTDHSSFRLKLRSSGQGAKVQLIQDLNQNGMAEANEILQAATVRSRKPRKAQVSRTGELDTPLDAGTYFVQVAANGRGTTNYRLALTSTALPKTEPPSTTPATNPLETLISQVVAITNEFRNQNGLLPLQPNSQLNAAAQTHTENMAVQDFFNHTGRDGSSPGSRMSAAGYQWSRAAENIAVGYSTAAEVVKGWIESPGHRANMLNPGLKEIGVGYYFLANDTGSQNWNYYWTQNFGAPL